MLDADLALRYCKWKIDKDGTAGTVDQVSDYGEQFTPTSRQDGGLHFGASESLSRTKPRPQISGIYQKLRQVGKLSVSS
jgi:hypothetical protein